jgi:hypothetical protein
MTTSTTCIVAAWTGSFGVVVNVRMPVFVVDLIR